MSVLIFLALTGLIGGGASIAAEASLPGDVLYPIKTGVNEPIRGVLAVGAEAKANLEAELAIRRLEEAQKLAVRGTIKEDVKTNLEARFKAFADRANEKIAKLEATGAVEASSDFQSALKAHSEILARLSAKESDDSEALSAFAIRINSALNNTVKLRTEAEVKISAEAGANVVTAAEGKMKAAVNKIEEVKKFVASMRARIGGESAIKAEAKISAAETLVAEGKVKLEAQAYNEAFILFQRAHQEAQEAKLTAESIIEINIGGNGNSEAKDDKDDDKNDEETEVEIELEAEGNNSGASGSLKTKIDL